VLRNRHFLLLWIAQAISQTTQNAIFFALMVFIEEKTGSTAHMSALILSTIAPSVLLGVAAGVIVDRMRKKYVLVATNVLRAIAVFGYVLLGDSFAAIYAVNLVFSMIAQFFGPAEAASIPLLVKRKQLVAANGLFNLTFTFSQLAGFVIIAPPVIKLFGVQALMVGSAGAYLLAALLVTLLPRGEQVLKPLLGLSRAELLGSLGEELRDGWHLLTRDTSIKLAMMNLTVTATLMLVVAELAPGFVSRVLGIRADDTVYVLAPAGAGVLLGTLTISRFVDRFGKAGVINFGLFVLAISLAVLALVRNAGNWLYSTMWTYPSTAADVTDLPLVLGTVMVAGMVAGLMFTFVNIPSQTILQERAPLNMRGKVFAVQLMFGNVAAVLPLVFIGALADLVGIVQVFVLVALVIFGVGVFSLARTKHLTDASMEEQSSSA
jgi:MFS family permease